MLMEHAKLEFRAMGWMDGSGRFTDEYQELICTRVLELLEQFSSHEHSGSSAPYAIDLFSRLARFNPLGPLTGDDWEWVEVSAGLYQNKRAPHVFKDASGAWDINGKVFWEWSGTKNNPQRQYYSNKQCHVPITFPYIIPDKPLYEYRYSDAEPLSPPQTEAGLL